MTKKSRKIEYTRDDSRPYLAPWIRLSGLFLRLSWWLKSSLGYSILSFLSFMGSFMGSVSFVFKPLTIYPLFFFTLEIRILSTRIASIFHWCTSFCEPLPLPVPIWFELIWWMNYSNIFILKSFRFLFSIFFLATSSNFQYATGIIYSLEINNNKK